MALAEDVLGILDELRSTDGKLKRARIIGRLWGAARKLPGEERRQLAAILAERYAPRLAGKLAAGEDVQSSELLGMIRAVGSVDADEISEIMERLSHPDERRELLTQVAESLQDDVAGADIGELVDDPSAAAAALAAAAHELAGDLDIVEDQPQPAGEPDPVTTEAAGSAPAQPEPPAASVLEEDAQAGAAAEPDETDDVAAASEPETPPFLPASPPIDQPPPGVPEPEERPMAAPPAEVEQPESEVGEAEEPLPPESDGASLVTAEELRSIPSPVARLRMLSVRLSGTLGRFDGPELAAAFPDGWQRRRAVAAMCRSLPSGNIERAVSMISTLGAPMQRRWVVRTVVDMWDLSAEEVAQLAAATDLPPSSVRLAPRG